jgi:hypothetical protein
MSASAIMKMISRESPTVESGSGRIPRGFPQGLRASDVQDLFLGDRRFSGACSGQLQSSSDSPESCFRCAPERRLAAVLLRLAFPALLILLLCGQVLAKEVAPGNDGTTFGGGDVVWYSRYVSRGVAMSEGPVLQPSAWIAIDDVTLSVFGNYVLTEEGQESRFNEADVSLAWSREWNGFIIEPAFILYTYPHSEEHSQYEPGLTLAREWGPWRLSTFHSLTFAVGEKASYYGEVAIGYQYDFSEKLSFVAEWAVSWPTPAASVEGRLSYDLTASLSLSLYAGCSIARSDVATSDDHDSGREDAISQGRNGFFGLGVGFSF